MGLLSVAEAGRTALSIAGALSARWWLSLDLGEALSTRIEISNAFNSVRGVREGLALEGLGMSPYTGSGFRGTPLLLYGQGVTANNAILRAVPCICADALAAVCLFILATSTQPRVPESASRRQPILTPTTIMHLFLWSPLAILSAAGSSGATFSLMAQLAMLAAAARGAPAAAALALAVATYLDIHNALFLPSLSLLLWHGPEDLWQEPTANALRSAGDIADPEVKPRKLRAVAGLPPEEVKRRVAAVARFFAVFVASAGALVLASDLLLLRQHAVHACLSGDRDSGAQIATSDAASLPWLASCAVAAWRRLMQPRSSPGSSAGAGQSACGGFGCEEEGRSSAAGWMREAYGGSVFYDDLTPNIGLWWYFVIEMFEELSAFYKFVLHMPCVLFAIPIAVRFFQRPMFVFLLQAILLASFKPYPVVADIALYVALLPLFFGCLRRAQAGIFLCALMLLTAVLGPAMHYQWIHTGLANSNFFYAVTLAWGSCQVVLLLMLMHAVLDHDRVLAGKPLAYSSAKRSDQ